MSETNLEQLSSLRVLSWNLGFGSRKPEFIAPDKVRAEKIVEIVRFLNPDVMALQELANRVYCDGSTFMLQEFFKNDPQFNFFHFEKTLSFLTRHSYPYGKLAQLRKKFAIQSQENGLGIGLRYNQHWQLANLYTKSTEYQAIVEVQRPLPHPLYMAEHPAPPGLEAQSEFSAGRDEEDRPVLWARLTPGSRYPAANLVYFVGVHLPTLKGEERNQKTGDLNRTQMNLLTNVLGFSESQAKNLTVDQGGSALRLHFLHQLMAQVKRLECYWQSENPMNQCVFILAGDFNFYHFESTATTKTPEQLFLENQGFMAAKSIGTSRPGSDRLIDNIWVRGAKRIRESYFSQDSQEVPIEQSGHKKVLNQLSDHYPVLANIYW